jgi:divalent metal cation (Fe/Co/Zn/Cd) transporter
MLLFFLAQFALKASDQQAEDVAAFAVVILILFFGSGIVWLIVRPLHHRWVEKKQKEILANWLEQFQREGIITPETLHRVKMRLQGW